MEKSRGSKKAVKAALLVMALVAALATTGCTGNKLMGPDSGTQVQGQVTAQQGGQKSNPGGQLQRP